MRERTIVISLIALYMAWGVVGFVIGRSDGKLAADRWWQAQKDIDTQIEGIKKDMERRNAWEALQGAAVGLLADCSNVDEETWTKRHCTQRKAKWEKEAKKFQ